MSIKPLMPASICHKLVMCTLFYQEIDIEVADRALRELLSASFPIRLDRKGLRTYSNPERSTCASVCETFTQVRSNRDDLNTIRGEFDEIIHIIYDLPQYFTVLGITLRFIVLVEFGGDIDPVNALNRVYLAKIGNAEDLIGAEIEAASMKFYFTRHSVPYELDVGPYLANPNNVYVELECRREKVTELPDFLQIWAADTRFLRDVINQMVCRIVATGAAG